MSSSSSQCFIPLVVDGAGDHTRGESGALGDNEEEVRVGDYILTRFKREVGKVRARMLTNKYKSASGYFMCPLCAFRGTRQSHKKREILKHLDNLHDYVHQFCPGGTKQLKCALAIHDDNVVRGKPNDDLLQEAASILRTTVKPALPQKSMTCIDKLIRLLLTERGPVYVHRDAIGSAVVARRVGYIFYTMEFAQALWREAVLCKCKFREILDRFRVRAADALNPLVHILPNKSRWHGLVEDVWDSPPVREWKRSAESQLIRNHEYFVLSVDTSVKKCFPILGQIPPHARAAEYPPPFEGEHALKEIVSVLGRTSAVVLLEAVPSKADEVVAGCIGANLPDKAKSQTQFIYTDGPTNGQFKRFKDVFPNLLVLALDTTHLAMNYEYASRKKRTAGSTLLRLIFAKFHNIGRSCTQSLWG